MINSIYQLKVIKQIKDTSLMLFTLNYCFSYLVVLFFETGLRCVLRLARKNDDQDHGVRHIKLFCKLN